MNKAVDDPIDASAAAEPPPRGERLDLPPGPRARAELPGDFGRRFLVFVDTEEEFDWSRPLARANTAVTAMEALPEAHRFFRAAGALPIYMSDWPVVDNARSAAILRNFHEQDGSEIETQLHPWVNPPFEEEVTGFNSFTGNLPLDLQRAKLTALTDRIAERIGTRPTVYRAGRYGVGPHTARLLEEAGYRMDASVRARFDYSDEGGPDFSRHPITPYWTGPSGRLLALPLTAGYIGGLRRWGDRLFRAAGRLPLARGGLARTGLLERVALTPEDYPLHAALEAVRRLLDDGHRLFSLSYHSPSVAPGHTPYVRDRADLEAFYRWWDGIFDLFARHSVTAARAGEAVSAARAMAGAAAA
ncbi:MAG: polysaccharide deacetylase family protein [Parasphingopyxis sp.]